MKLLFKQRFFSWLDSYDIYDENGRTVFTVEGKLAWGHKLEVHDASGRHVATLQEKILTLLPRFELYIEGCFMGEIVKEFSFFKPSFSIECSGWKAEGDFWEWDYHITDSLGRTVAQIEKQLFNWSDTYVIDVAEPQDSLLALLVVLAIDAVKCDNNS